MKYEDQTEVKRINREFDFRVLKGALPDSINSGEAWGFFKALECAGILDCGKTFGSEISQFRGGAEEFRSAVEGFIKGVRGAVHWTGNYAALERPGLRDCLLELYDLWENTGGNGVGSQKRGRFSSIKEFRRLCCELENEFSVAVSSLPLLAANSGQAMSHIDWLKLRNLLWEEPGGRAATQ